MSNFLANRFSIMSSGNRDGRFVSVYVYLERFSWTSYLFDRSKRFYISVRFAILSKSTWRYGMVLSHAASMLLVLPIVIVFFFTQKNFMDGISMTGLKG